MQRARYRPRPTQEHIHSFGVNVRWDRAIKCPCLNDQGQNSRLCEICRGHGYAYPDSFKIRGLLTGMRNQEALALAGLLKTGEMMFTPQAGIRMDDGDRLTLLQYDRRESEIVEREDDDRDRLLHPEPLRIVAVYQKRGEALHKFEATSYRLEEGRIVWVPDTDQPDPGSMYTVQYDYRPQYMVYRMDDPQYRGLQGHVLPQAVKIKLITPIHGREQ